MDLAAPQIGEAHNSPPYSCQYKESGLSEISQWFVSQKAAGKIYSIIQKI